jgi:hypothetical protein
MGNASEHGFIHFIRAGKVNGGREDIKGEGEGGRL